MTVTQVGTAHLPADDRFAFWCELADSSHVPTILRTEHAGGWNATMRLHDLGVLTASAQSHPACTANRTPRLIRRSDPEQLYLMYPTSGQMIARQGELEAVLGTDSLVVLDTSRPVTVVSPTPTEHVLVQFPRQLLPANRRFDHLLATAIPARAGLGGAMVAVLQELLTGGYPVAVVAELTQTVLDLFLALELAAGGDAPTMPAGSRDRAKALQICAYLRRNLGDAGLTLAQVAGAHGLSLRQLDRLFQQDGTTPAAWLRDQRLRRCRRDLLDPTQSRTPVHLVGARWGFADPVTFHRAFHRVYGMPPGEYRRRFGRA